MRRHGFDCFEFGASEVGKDLMRFLEGLPKPVAVFAAFDLRARQLLDACTEAGLKVPLDVAILGVDNEEMIAANTDHALTTADLVGRLNVSRRTIEIQYRMNHV